MISLAVAAFAAIGWLGVDLAKPPSRDATLAIGSGVALSAFAAVAKSSEHHDVVEFCEGVARALRSSRSFEAAVWAGAEWTTGVLEVELSLARERVDAGEDIDVALRRVGERIQSDELDRVIDAIALCRPTGGPTAAVFDVMADAARQERDLESEMAALAAPARTSALVVGLLPLAFALLAVVVDPTVVSSLISWPTGIVCMIAGVVAELVGFVWMRRIVMVA